MNFPIQLRFKLLAIRTRVFVVDGRGGLLWVVRQAFFKLKERVEVFGDESCASLKYLVEADRILDFSANYEVKDVESGCVLGAVRRRGMRSIWRASYEIYDEGGGKVYEVREKSVWVKVVDSLLGEVPILNLLTGYLFHPSYVVNGVGGGEVFVLRKQAAFFEGKFLLESVVGDGVVDGDQQVLVVLALMMVTILERGRG